MMDEKLLSYPPTIHPSWVWWLEKVISYPPTIHLSWVWWMEKVISYPPTIHLSWVWWMKSDFLSTQPSISHGYDGWKIDFLSTHHPSLMGMMDERGICYPPTILLSWVLLGMIVWFIPGPKRARMRGSRARGGGGGGGGVGIEYAGAHPLGRMV